MTTTTLPLPEPPDAPDYLAGSAGDGTVELSWTAPHSGADGYRVYLDDQLIAQTTELSMTIDGLPNDQAYGFSVSAYSAFGESARTPTLWLTPRTSGSSPTTPSTAPPTTGAPSPSTAPVAPGPSAPSTPTTTPTTTTPAPAPSPYTVSPGSGPTSGGTFVSITGPNLGQLQGVDIDGAFLDGVMVLGNNWALGMTRPHAQPGTYDLVLHLAGRTVAVPGAFTYTGTAPPPTTTPATAPPATQPPLTQPPATQPPSTQPPVTQPPVTQPPAPPITDAPTTTTTAVPALPQVPGLELAPLPPTSPLADLPAGVWDGIACRASTCAG